MADNMQANGFQQVKNRRNQKNKRRNPTKNHRDILLNDYTDEIDKESLLGRVNDCRLDISGSEFMEEVKGLLEQIKLQIQRIKNQQSDSTQKACSYEDQLRIVCYGIGNFTSCPIARYQLALALILRDELLPLDSKCEIYDPIFSKPEEEILSELDFEILEVNEEGKREVSGPTLFYMPHCGRPLYNNLLWANWRPEQLSRLLIIGNSFRDMADRTPERIFKTQSAYIHKILPHVADHHIKNSFRFGDIFNDTIFQYFPAENLTLLEKSIWEERVEPVYDPEEVEIITK